MPKMRRVTKAMRSPSTPRAVPIRTMLSGISGPSTPTISIAMPAAAAARHTPVGEKRHEVHDAARGGDRDQEEAERQAPEHRLRDRFPAGAAGRRFRGHRALGDLAAWPVS